MYTHIEKALRAPKMFILAHFPSIMSGGGSVFLLLLQPGTPVASARVRLLLNGIIPAPPPLPPETSVCSPARSGGHTHTHTHR